MVGRRPSRQDLRDGSRRRLSLHTLMALVAVTALALASVQAWRRQAHYRERAAWYAAREQEELGIAVISEKYAAQCAERATFYLKEFESTQKPGDKAFYLDRCKKMLDTVRHELRQVDVALAAAAEYARNKQMCLDRLW